MALSATKADPHLMCPVHLVRCTRLSGLPIVFDNYSFEEITASLLFSKLITTGCELYIRDSASGSMLPRAELLSHTSPCGNKEKDTAN